MVLYLVQMDMGNWYLLNYLFPVQFWILFSPVEPILVVCIVVCWCVESLSLVGVGGSLSAIVLALSEGLMIVPVN